MDSNTIRELCAFLAFEHGEDLAAGDAMLLHDDACWIVSAHLASSLVILGQRQIDLSRSTVCTIHRCRPE